MASFYLTTELASKLESRIDDIASARPIVDESAHLIAIEHRALPLVKGVEEHYAITLSGEVVAFEWSHFEEPLPVFSIGRAYGVIAAASKKYPELLALLPAPSSEGDDTCEHCLGTGTHPLREQTGDARVVCECGGLGYVPRRMPTGEPTAPRYRSSVFPNFTPSNFKTGYLYELIADDDVQTEDELGRLLDAMYEDPEHEFVYYAPSTRIGNAEIARAFGDKILSRGDVENFYYRRAPNTRRFVRVEPHCLDDSHAEVIFGLETHHILSLQELATGEMYSKSLLTLTERTRRAIAAERARDTALVEVKWGLGGVKLDVRKSLAFLRDWWRERRSRRSG